MLPRFQGPALSGRSSLVLGCLAVVLATTLTGAQRGAIKKPGFDPSAEKVEMFDAMEQGLLSVKLVPKDSKQGNVFFENKSDKPLTVKLPEAVVGVQVLKQFGGGMGGQQGGMGGMGGQQGGMGGQSQQMGGGMGGGGGMMGGGGGGMMGGGGGGGFFSIPPEKTVQLPMHSVCLAHGKAEPKPRMTYELIPVESHTSDPLLQELLKLYGTGKMDQGAAQAATWHLTDKMSWQELANKQIKHLGGVPPTPYFTFEQLQLGQQLVSMASARVREREKESNPRQKTAVKKL